MGNRCIMDNSTHLGMLVGRFLFHMVFMVALYINFFWVNTVCYLNLLFLVLSYIPESLVFH